MEIRSEREHWLFELDDADAVNRQVLEQLAVKLSTDVVEQSHHFAGRFENIYLPVAEIPAVQGVIDAAVAATAEIMGREPDRLRAGFWFNIMSPGNVTQVHHHDEDGELLSAVYYLSVPDNSGNLILRTQPPQTITPGAGTMILFAPELMHEVSVHTGEGERISIGINIGPC